MNQNNQENEHLPSTLKIQIVSREEILSTFWFSREISFVDFDEAYLWLICILKKEI